MLRLSYLLDVLQRDPVLSQLLVDKHQGVEIPHSPIQKLVGKIPGAFNHCLVKLQQPRREKKGHKCKKIRMISKNKGDIC